MGMTKQRAAVMEAVNNCKDHPTADTIFAAVRERMPNIGLGTVYRNLNILCDEGKVLRVRTPGGADHFDFNITPHNHFYCRECGNVWDVDMPLIDLTQVSGMDGFVIDTCHLIAEGLCKDCAAEQQ